MSQFNKGQSFQVKGYTPGCDTAFRARLLAMGLTKGTVCAIEAVAPMGCPILLSVRGTQLMLRKHEASILEVEAV